METNKTPYSDLPVPPGEYLEEVIEELGMTKDELARRMNRPAPKLSSIFKGEKTITPDTALQLEKVVGVPAHIWTGLEAEYRLAIARRQEKDEQKRLKEESRQVKKFRYIELVKLGVVGKKTQPTEKALELQKFFGVTSLNNILNIRRYQAAFRFGGIAKRKRSPEAVAAWLRIGELKAQEIHCTPFQARLLRKVMASIRDMTRLPPERFLDDLHQFLTEAGVALVLCPHLTGTYVHGATFWLGREKAVVMMTIRGKWADIFWFSLFHELGHILLHNRQTVFIEGKDSDPAFQQQEDEANRFAADTLIYPKQYKEFVMGNRFYPEDIIKFSERMGIDPGILVGRLQHDGYLDRSWYNDLRTRFEWQQKT